MNWIDIASIVFACVTANHLGLIKAIEEQIEQELPIINCPKCLTWWCVIFYGLWCVGFSDLPLLLAISFLASYAALWLEMSEAYIDTLYMKLYEKITAANTNNAPAADAKRGDSAGTLPEL